MKGRVLSYSMVSADRYGSRSRFEKLSVWHSATLEFFGHELPIDVKSGGERIGNGTGYWCGPTTHCSLVDSGQLITIW